MTDGTMIYNPTGPGRHEQRHDVLQPGARPDRPGGAATCWRPRRSSSKASTAPRSYHQCQQLINEGIQDGKDVIMRHGDVIDTLARTAFRRPTSAWATTSDLSSRAADGALRSQPRERGATPRLASLSACRRPICLGDKNVDDIRRSACGRCRRCWAWNRCPSRCGSSRSSPQHTVT